MKSVFQIKEYGSFVCNKNVPGYVSLPERTFSALENFVLTNQNNEVDVLELMGLSARKGVGRIITAKNYVGVIAMKDGTIIEILPKIYSEIDTDEGGLRTKKLLIDMLKTLHEVPCKSVQMSNMDIGRISIYEIFIRMFIDETYFIVKRGLKGSYELIDENTRFFKGKINFSQQIIYNHSHKERSFVEYDKFSVNRPENRLLKATLLYLYKHSSSSRNRNDIKILLDAFGEIEASVDYESDFSKLVPDRNMKDYSTALFWSRVFLKGNSFTSFTGSEVAFALLFPMDVLFESYIAALLRKTLDRRDYSICIQDCSRYLFNKPDKKFLIKPDIVITRKIDNNIFILDTKWKMLSDRKLNYGISQGDMYQMYAYHKKYSASSVTLIYPRTERIGENNSIEFSSDDGVSVRIVFVDLFKQQKQMVDVVCL